MLLFNLFSVQFLSNFPTVVNASSTYSPSDIISLTNQDRVANGLPVLNDNAKLDSAAYAKMEDMFKYQYWAHYNPTTGASPWSFILAAGYNYQYAGENLAQGYWSAQDVNNAWLNSPEHRANILNKDYLDIGVALQQGMLMGSNVILVVEMFGAQQSVIAPTPNSTPTPTQIIQPTKTPIFTIIPTTTYIKTITPSATPFITQTPTLTASPTPTINAGIINSPTPTFPPKSTILPTILQKAIQPKSNPSNSLIEDFRGRVQNMSFANRVDISVAIFLLVIFSLDGIYYYKVKDLHKRAGINSISHIPLLLIFIAICIIGVNGLTI